MNALEILKAARLEVAPETFTLVSIRHEDWLKLLENPALSPRMTAPFMIFKDKFETTLLLDDVDFEQVRYAVLNAKFEQNFRLLTLDIELGFSVVGFLAEVARILAEAEVPIVALSAFSRDHLLIKQMDLPKALRILSGYTNDVN